MQLLGTQGLWFTFAVAIMDTELILDVAGLHVPLNTVDSCITYNRLLKALKLSIKLLNTLKLKASMIALEKEEKRVTKSQRVS